MNKYTVPRERATPTLTISRETSERGGRLAKARDDAGLDQKQVARELHAAGLLPSPRFQTISEWERGKGEPGLEQLMWLRERYGFDWGWFFSGADAEKELRAYRRIVRVVLETEGAEAVRKFADAAIRARKDLK